MTSTLFILGSVVIVSAVSLVGIVLIGLRDRLFQRILFVLISFAVGALLGDVFIHIIPELLEGESDLPVSGPLLILGGILLSFLLEKFIHWHHCHDVDCHDHAHHVGTVCLIGDGVHNITDGILIAGSYLVDIPTGIATTLAVVLHEIPQEIGDYAILRHSGFTRGRALFLNFITAITALLGAAAVLLLRGAMPNLEQYLLPIVAGNFLYIAIADLLPELHKQTKPSRSALQFLGVLVGIALMWSLTFLE